MRRGTRIRIVLLVVAVVFVLMLLGRGAAGPEVEDGSTLLLDVSGQYVEAVEPSLLMRVLGREERPFVSLLGTLALAERDGRLDTVVLRIRDLDIGWGKANELRAAVDRLGEAGRKTIAYLEVGGFQANKELYVASAADEVYLAPGSVVPLVGLAAEYLHLGGLWEKVGIEIEVAKVGRYKSATEAIAGSEMSDATREMVNSILDSFSDQFVAGIAEGRGLSVEEVRSAIDQGPVRPKAFVSLGLVDDVVPLYELPAMKGKVVKGGTYASVDPASVGFEPVARLALIYGSGNVVSGEGTISRGGSRVFASKTVGRALRDAAEDPTIAGIIFRIDSPGGSSLAAEEVWRAVEQAKESGKPIIASFSDLAASGGYYAATGADAIVSAPATLTGSIGVYSLRPVLGELLDNLGIHVESLQRGRHADFLLSSSALSDGARERLQDAVDVIYELFLSRVSVGRGMETDEVDGVAQGRVWTGEQAFEQGLVDEVGGLRTAVLRAKRALDLAEDADVALVPYPAPPSLAEQLQEIMRGEALAQLRGAPGGGLWGQLGLPTIVVELATWLSELPTGTPLLVPPLILEVR